MKMKCKICEKEFEPYKIYDLPSSLKVDSYICKSCLFVETTMWNINNPHDIRTWKHGSNDIIVDGEMSK